MGIMKTSQCSCDTLLLCLQLMAGQSICVGSTLLTNTTGEISTEALFGGNYSAGTECSWTINVPDSPFISLAFTTFNTESLYDPVVVEVRPRHCYLLMVHVTTHGCNSVACWHRKA
jgi:hypothetical protein